jgi:hypothetical protein
VVFAVAELTEFTIYNTSGIFGHQHFVYRQVLWKISLYFDFAELTV